jgi:hypothetical protein
VGAPGSSLYRGFMIEPSIKRLINKRTFSLGTCLVKSYPWVSASEDSLDGASNAIPGRQFY